MRIQSLLNPSINGEAGSEDRRMVTRRSSTSAQRTLSALPASTPKRQRIAKDAPIFTQGRFRGDVRYPPYEDDKTPELAAQHKRFQIYPMGDIAKYCRHIPYNSEKKSFLEKTGREAFEGMSSGPKRKKKGLENGSLTKLRSFSVHF